MIILAKIIGCAIVAMGTAIAINPNTFKVVINFWRRGKNVYLAGALRIIFGVIFLLVAPLGRLPAVISVLGVLMIIGGIVIFVIGPERIQAIFDWWGKKPPSVMRLMGIVAFSIGILILYLV